MRENERAHFALVAADNVARRPRAPLCHFAVGLLTAASARRLLAWHDFARLADARRAASTLNDEHREQINHNG